jgi:hypothetical protein
MKRKQVVAGKSRASVGSMSIAEICAALKPGELRTFLTVTGGLLIAIVLGAFKLGGLFTCTAGGMVYDAPARPSSYLRVPSYRMIVLMSDQIAIEKVTVVEVATMPGCRVTNLGLEIDTKTLTEASWLEIGNKPCGFSGPSGLDFKAIPVSIFVSEAILKSCDLEDDNLYFIGLFAQFYRTKKDSPVIRHRDNAIHQLFKNR